MCIWVFALHNVHMALHCINDALRLNWKMCILVFAFHYVLLAFVLHDVQLCILVSSFLHRKSCTSFFKLQNQYQILQLLSTLFKKALCRPPLFSEHICRLQFLLTDLKSRSMLWWSSLLCGWLLRNETERLGNHPPPFTSARRGNLREILGSDNFDLLPKTILPGRLWVMKKA